MSLDQSVKDVPGRTTFQPFGLYGIADGFIWWRSWKDLWGVS